MSMLKQKSDFNIFAAEILLTKSCFAPSVHCSYYSCFQLLKYTIKDFFGIDYETLASKISLSEQKTHDYVISYITLELKNLAGVEESTKFKRKIKDLKQFRVDSDYEDIEINADKGYLALKKAKEIREYIITNFHV